MTTPAEQLAQKLRDFFLPYDISGWPHVWRALGDEEEEQFATVEDLIYAQKLQTKGGVPLRSMVYLKRAFDTAIPGPYEDPLSMNGASRNHSLVVAIDQPQIARRKGVRLTRVLGVIGDSLRDELVTQVPGNQQIATPAVGVTEALVESITGVGTMNAAGEIMLKRCLEADLWPTLPEGAEVPAVAWANDIAQHGLQIRTI